MGQRAAAARQALPADLQKSVRDTAVWQGRMDQLQGFAPVQPARNTAQLGAALERLPELQQALAKQVLGAELTQRLAIALRVERQWERSKTQERGLEL